jgi:hypothetical protein
MKGNKAYNVLKGLRYDNTMMSYLKMLYISVTILVVGCALVIVDYRFIVIALIGYASSMFFLFSLIHAGYKLSECIQNIKEIENRVD